MTLGKDNLKTGSMISTPVKANNKKDYDSIRSRGDEDFSNYFILKQKFDEIHVFIARIAGLVAHSIQDSRHRHASPKLKDRFGIEKKGSSSNLKKWLIASPSKS